VECGSHNDLMQSATGVYRELVELQDVHREKDGAKTAATDSAMAGDPDEIPELSIDEASKIGVSDSRGVVRRSDDDSKGEKSGDIDSGVFFRSFALNRGEAPVILLGVIGAIMSGATWPVSALLFAEVTTLLPDPEKESKIAFWSVMYIVVGFAALVGNVLQMGMLGISGEKLTRKMRGMTFRALLRQEIGFFDKDENAVGALTTRLATEASAIKGITGDTLGATALTLSTILVGIAVAFWGCWRLALVVLACLPAIALGGAMQMKSMSGFDAGASKMYEESGAVASEAVDNVRTISGWYSACLH
jgi:ATP-binding cassette, subfamily B (MDR/TAP), member 1